MSITTHNPNKKGFQNFIILWVWFETICLKASQEVAYETPMQKQRTVINTLSFLADNLL